MSAPTVTITVKGSSATSAEDVDTLSQHLFMTYVQAVKGEVRRQWIIFPPAVGVLGVDGQTLGSSAGKVKVLTRKQEFIGNRSKWFHKLYTSEDVAERLDRYKASGFAISTPVLAELELDDYQEVWQGKTSHKAIRAVDRAVGKVLNTQVK